MGFDISHHAVDTRLMTERLIPGLLGQVSIDRLLDRTAGLCVVAGRANQWRLRVVELKHRFFRKQMEAKFEKFFGLPGFDTELSVWGRPFFIVADTVEESLAAFWRYMECAHTDLSAVDRIARSMIAKLDSDLPRLLSKLPPAAVPILETFRPLAEHLPELNAHEMQDVDRAAARSCLASVFDTYREGWTSRNTDRVIESDVLEEPALAADLAKESPYVLLNLAAQVLPGWMGRGHFSPTRLFEKINVPVSHVFETPTALFEPLVRACPEIEDSFRTTILRNQGLGGYVRPEKVPALRALLQKHERELILAWTEPTDQAGADFDELSTDYKKILEPVILAERKGYGFIEAAEIYSGFLGVMT